MIDTEIDWQADLDEHTVKLLKYLMIEYTPAQSVILLTNAIDAILMTYKISDEEKPHVLEMFRQLGVISDREFSH